MESIFCKKTGLLLLLLTWVCLLKASAQTTASPFDLLPRVKNAAEIDTVAITVSTNPFDIVKITALNRPDVPVRSGGLRIEKQEKRLSAKEKGTIYNRFVFITILVMLIVLTLVVTLFRLLIEKIWKAFINDTMLNQLLREQSAGITAAYVILYALFFINAGIFTFLTAGYFQLPLPESNFWALAACTGSIAVFFLSKHFLLRSTGFIFPVVKEENVYQFTILVFNIVLGLFLAPVILVIGYAAPDIAKYVIYGTLGVLAATYLFLHLRGLFIAGRFLVWHKFHFLLYLCAVEIIPLLLVLKLA